MLDMKLVKRGVAQENYYPDCIAGKISQLRDEQRLNCEVFEETISFFNIIPVLEVKSKHYQRLPHIRFRSGVKPGEDRLLSLFKHGSSLYSIKRGGRREDLGRKDTKELLDHQ